MTRLYANNPNGKEVKAYFNSLSMDRSISYSIVVHIGNQIYSKSVEISKMYPEVNEYLLKKQLVAEILDHIKEKISKELEI